MTLAFIGITTEGHAQQADAPVNIPLYYYYDPSNPLLDNAIEGRFVWAF